MKKRGSLSEEKACEENVAKQGTGNRKGGGGAAGPEAERGQSLEMRSEGVPRSQMLQVLVGH